MVYKQPEGEKRALIPEYEIYAKIEHSYEPGAIPKQKSILSISEHLFSNDYISTNNNRFSLKSLKPKRRSSSTSPYDLPGKLYELNLSETLYFHLKIFY